MTRKRFGSVRRILALALVAGILALGLRTGFEAAEGGPEATEAAGVIIGGPRR